MNELSYDVVTGAYGYLGKYITRILLEQGKKVITLTGRPDRPNEFGDAIKAVPFNFDKSDQLTKSLSGAHTVYNTYWVRFNRKETTYDNAVANTKILIDSAKKADVKRFVHVSITNPDLKSRRPYFKGKAILEDYLKNSGLSYAIIRPAVLFGKEDILINNIAWLLRRSPVFGIFGDGEYKLQPVYVQDAAKLAVELGQSEKNITIDAVGSETFSFVELVKLVRNRIGSRSLIMKIPPQFGYLVGKLIGAIVGDVVVTKDEIEGLSANLLISNEKPTCPTKFTDWLNENASSLGRQYASELKRHYV